MLEQKLLKAHTTDTKIELETMKAVVAKLEARSLKQTKELEESKLDCKSANNKISELETRITLSQEELSKNQLFYNDLKLD